jgi:hypothetical protein
MRVGVGLPTTMPPQPLEYEGHEPIAAFLRHREESAGRRCIPVASADARIALTLREL